MKRVLNLVIAGIACLALPVPSLAGGQTATATALPAAPIASYVTEAASRFAIPESWIYAVMRVESGGNRRAISPKCAAGLMQIMPSTWATLRARYDLGNDVYDAHDNVVAGAGYLREMYDRYGSPGFLAAYNAGPIRYEDYLRSRRPLPAETVDYVNRLAPATATGAVRNVVIPPPDPNAWTRATLFIARDEAVSSAEAAPALRLPTVNASAGAKAESLTPRESLFPPHSGPSSR